MKWNGNEKSPGHLKKNNGTTPMRTRKSELPVGTLMSNKNSSHY